MNTREALEMVCDIASSWGENSEEGLPTRIDGGWDDEMVRAEMGENADDYEMEQALRVRDLWRALERVQAVLAQRGCEHFDSACVDGSLTTLCDIVIDG